MTDNSRVMAATIAGAMIGGLAGYLCLTNRGREVRQQIGPALDDLARELSSFRLTAQKAAGVATEGWKLLNEAMEQGPEIRRYPNAHQTSPF